MKGILLRYTRFTCLLWLGFLLACKHEIPVQPAPENPGNPGGNNPIDTGQPCDPNTVYFQRDVLPILLSNCTMSGCHNATDREDDVVLDNYANVMATADVRPGNASGSDLFEVLVEDDEDKRMPYGMNKLPAAQIAIIQTWINQGAKNEICGTNACDTASVTYSAVIKPLVQTNCSGCHNNSLASGGYNFSTHSGLAVAANNGKLVGAVSHAAGFKPMPQGGKLTDCQIAQIRKWVSLGALNN
ncbi:hypothetical protein I5M27_05145 [Adhaeribacter sp. BT258]|uniref:Cytochrome C Planctomycete-type domain-containing protein n=1 Tax=Adhaeribacter terrigena TaxID=2793070 RepID=A0ABS1BZ55_9BACT|nr:c-type cytochrome domain-containing protein [Adhaeribacter terrigena]MBK0402359.1 hypothetical protein [Adhaeribacter terrigena]